MSAARGRQRVLTRACQHKTVSASEYWPPWCSIQEPHIQRLPRRDERHHEERRKHVHIEHSDDAGDWDVLCRGDREHERHQHEDHCERDLQALTKVGRVEAEAQACKQHDHVDRQRNVEQVVAGAAPDDATGLTLKISHLALGVDLDATAANVVLKQLPLAGALAQGEAIRDSKNVRRVPLLKRYELVGCQAFSLPGVQHATQDCIAFIERHPVKVKIVGVQPLHVQQEVLELQLLLRPVSPDELFQLVVSLLGLKPDWPLVAVRNQCAQVHVHIHLQVGCKLLFSRIHRRDLVDHDNKMAHGWMDMPSSSVLSAPDGSSSSPAESSLDEGGVFESETACDARKESLCTGGTFKLSTALPFCSLVFLCRKPALRMKRALGACTGASASNGCVRFGAEHPS
eukprot:366474-Chlamydomonas_euryale.AAC.16